MEIVIFDTNAYRNLSTDKDFIELETDVQKFKQIEQIIRRDKLKLFMLGFFGKYRCFF